MDSPRRVATENVDTSWKYLEKENVNASWNRVEPENIDAGGERDVEAAIAGVLLSALVAAGCAVEGPADPRTIRSPTRREARRRRRWRTRAPPPSHRG